MAPVDDKTIVAAYLAAAKAAGKGIDAAVKAVISATLGPQFESASGAIATVISKTLDQVGMGPEKFAILLAVHIEYLKRTKHTSASTKWCNICLKNKCSVCGLCGHNKSNHPKGLESKLKQVGWTSDKLDMLSSAHSGALTEFDKAGGLM